MNKTQVAALIRVLDNDTRREYLRNAYFVLINKKVYLIGTNSYCAFALEVDQSLKKMIGKAINVNEFIIWKAINKGRGKQLEINSLKAKNYENKNFIKSVKNVVVQHMKSHEEDKGCEMIMFNPKYVSDMQQINGSELLWNLHSGCKALTSLTRNGDFYMVLPMRVNC